MMRQMEADGGEWWHVLVRKRDVEWRAKGYVKLSI